VEDQGGKSRSHPGRKNVPRGQKNWSELKKGVYEMLISVGGKGVGGLIRMVLGQSGNGVQGTNMCDRKKAGKERGKKGGLKVVLNSIPKERGHPRIGKKSKRRTSHKSRLPDTKMKTCG